MEKKVHNEHIGKSISILNTIDHSDTFPYDEFFNLEQTELGHDIPNSGVTVCKNDNLTFAQGEESLIAFAAMNGPNLAGVAYVWMRDLTIAKEDRIFVSTDYGFKLVPIADTIATALGVQGHVYELELGGSIVLPTMRRSGVYKKLFNERITRVKAGLLTGRLQTSNRGVSIPQEDLFFTLCSQGHYNSNLLKDARLKGYMIFEEIDEMGISPNLIGLPRPQSSPSSHLAKKAQMNLIGFSSNDLGPIYATQFNNLEAVS